MILDNINNYSFLLNALKENIRLCGRKFFDSRPFHVTLDSTDIRKTVQGALGDTKVMVSIDAQVTSPFPDRPVEGIVQLKVSFMPNYMDNSLKNEMMEEEMHLSRILQTVFRDHRLINTEALCLIPGKKVWSISIHLHILNNDGNMLDTSNQTILAALLHFRLPSFSILENDQINFYSFHDKNPLPLAIQYMPICITFAIFDGSLGVPSATGHHFQSLNHRRKIKGKMVDQKDLILLMDPSVIEEKYSHGILTVCIDSQKKDICLMHKKGLSIPAEVIFSTLEYASLKSIDLSTIIRSSIPK